MFWFFVIGIVILLFIGAASASGAQKAASTINAMAQMVGSEERFREYWRFLHRELVKSELPKDKEEQIVQRYLRGYLELVDQFKTVTPDNVKVIAPALATQSDSKEIEIANSISPEFGKVMSKKWKRESAQKKYMKNVLGIKL